VNRATIALCMIVRDEELRLPSCLASVAGLCDERIVVDTGSQDDTVAVAERAGARVIHFPWCDDFAAARNAGLREATCDWVLVLDADEQLAPGDDARVRQAVAEAPCACGTLELHDAARLDATAEEILSGRARSGEPMAVPRLFRRTSDLAFEGIVHESVRAWLVRNGARTWDTGARIVHFGAVPSLRVDRDKHRRNARLLERRLESEPEDFTVHGYLAHELIAAGDLERALTVADAGFRHVRGATPVTLRSATRLMAARCLLQFQRADADGMLATVADAIAYEGEGPDALFFRGRAHELRALTQRLHRDDELERATAAYRACLTWASRPVGQRFVVGASGWSGRARLATVRLLAGDADEALPLYEASLAEHPDQDEAALGACEALIELGRPETALARLEPLRRELPRSDAWILSARAALELGRTDDMKRYLAGVRERASMGQTGLHRRETHAALLCALTALLGRPQAGPGAVGVACGWMGGHAGTETVTRGEQRILTSVIRSILQAGQAPLAERLLLPEVEAALPGIVTLVKQAVRELGMSIEDRN